MSVNFKHCRALYFVPNAINLVMWPVGFGIFHATSKSSLYWMLMIICFNQVDE